MKKSNKLLLNGEEIKLDIDSISYEDLLGSERPLEWGVIVEKGNNSNGEYVKYGNGLMLCYMATRVTDQTIATEYGPLFFGTRNWIFPKEFMEPPVVTCSQFKAGTGASFGSVMSITKSNASLMGFDIVSRAIGVDIRITAWAIGRWK